jgi:hypothetical protein
MLPVSCFAPQGLRKSITILAVCGGSSDLPELAVCGDECIKVEQPRNAIRRRRQDLDRCLAFNRAQRGGRSMCMTGMPAGTEAGQIAGAAAGRK